MAENEKPSLIKDEVQEEKAPRELKYEPLKPGESLEAFAERHNTTVEQILEDNQVNPDYLFFGHWLYV